MSDNKKYYYMRLKENFFDSNEIVVLESMQDGYLYSNILLKLYLRSLKNDGKLMFNDRIPYNAQMIATITRHQVGTVEKALQIFRDMGLIEVMESGAIYMLDIQNYIGKTSTESDRKRAYRKRIASDKMCLPEYEDKCPDNLPPEIEIEIEKEIELETEIKIDYQKIISMYNETCVSFPHLRSLSESRKKAIRARIKSGYAYCDFQTVFDKAEASSFLKGGNDRNWSATFDWLIKDANMAKVLDGNYDDRSGKHGQHGKDTGNHAEASDRWGDLEITVL